jgi:hypothetical protein
MDLGSSKDGIIIEITLKLGVHSEMVCDRNQAGYIMIDKISVNDCIDNMIGFINDYALGTLNDSEIEESHGGSFLQSHIKQIFHARLEPKALVTIIN